MNILISYVSFREGISAVSEIFSNFPFLGGLGVGILSAMLGICF
jgi:hypothetical protein